MLVQTIKINKNTNFKIELWQQVVIALILGVITGFLFKEQTEIFKFLGIIFINAIKMVTIPLVFFSILAGVTNRGEVSNVSRVTIKSIVAFLLTSVFAVLIGIGSTLLLKAGVGSKFDFLSLSSANQANSDALPKVHEIFINIIPTNIFTALAEGNILQIVLFAFFAGVTLNLIKDKAPKTIELVAEFAQLSFKMIEIVVKLAPLGVFGYISWSVGVQGFEVLIPLSKLFIMILIACILQYIVFGVFIIIFARLNPLPFFKKMIEPQLLAFATSSSKASLPVTMRILHEKLGVSKGNTDFIMPVGSSINMDGGAIYLGVCVIFFAQALGFDLQLYHYVILVIMCTLGSIGAAGIPSGIMLFLGVTLTSVGMPIEIVALVATIDRFIDMLTTAINITGDACITLIVDKSENQLDKTIYYNYD